MESRIITADTPVATLEGNFDTDRWGRIEMFGASHFTYGEGGGVLFSGRDTDGTLFVAALPYGDRIRTI